MEFFTIGVYNSIEQELMVKYRIVPQVSGFQIKISQEVLFTKR